MSLSSLHNKGLCLYRMDRYCVGKQIGEGAFGYVYHAVKKGNGEQVSDP